MLHRNTFYIKDLDNAEKTLILKFLHQRHSVLESYLICSLHLIGDILDFRFTEFMTLF